MSTVIRQTTHVYADTIPDVPCAVINYYSGQYRVRLFTGSNSQDLPDPFDTIDEAIQVATGHADTLDADDGKDTNLDLRFRIKELEAVIAELRAGRDTTVDAVT